MKSIAFSEVFPRFFEGQLPSGAPSQVWGNSFDFKRGESYLIKADSGRGKTSLCSFISLMRNDFSGKILFDGKSSCELSREDRLQVKRHVLSVMYQDLKLFDNLNAIENVLVRSSLCCGADAVSARTMLERLGLDEGMQTRPVSTLSLGQQQRVAFVRMLSCPADFRILDEPVSHLDARAAGVMAEMLREACGRDGAGVIVTSVGYDFPYEYDHTFLL